MKNSNDTIGNRTPELTASSAVPQTAAPPRTISVFRYNSTIQLDMRKKFTNLLSHESLTLTRISALVRSELSPL